MWWVKHRPICHPLICALDYVRVNSFTIQDFLINTNSSFFFFFCSIICTLNDVFPFFHIFLHAVLLSCRGRKSTHIHKNTNCSSFNLCAHTHRDMQVRKHTQHQIEGSQLWPGLTPTHPAFMNIYKKSIRVRKLLKALSMCSVFSHLPHWSWQVSPFLFWILA